MIPEYLTLERAIANFKNNPSQDNALILRDKMITSNYFLFLHPSLFSDQNGQTREQLERSLRTGMYEKIPVLLFDTHSEAGLILPVFTSRAEAEKFPSPGINDLIEIHFAALYEMVRKSAKANSVLINPEGDAIAFGRSQFLESFTTAAINISQQQLPAGSVMTFAQGKEDAGPIAGRALRHEARKYTDISRLWLTRQIENGEATRWFLVIETDKPRKDGHQQLAAMFLQSLGKGSAGVCYSDNEMAADIIEQFEPFYVR